jgi:hypothetical protein
MQQYVVRRAFKCGGMLYTPGMIVTEEDPIKLFRTKCRENKLVPLETDGDAAQRQKDYFAGKLGVEISVKAPIKREVKGSSRAEKPEAKAKQTETPPTGTPKKVLTTATKPKTSK